MANLAFIFPVCLIPFATAWWAHALSSPVPWIVYCAVMVATSLGNLALVLIVNARRRAAAGWRDQPARAALPGRARGSPGVAFALGIVLFARGLHLSQFCWLLIPILMALCARFLGPKAANEASA